MAKVYTAVDQLIGNTPLLELCRIEERLGLKAKLLAKLEYLNPAGSAKDRIGLAMIDAAERDGRLRPGSVIIEPTPATPASACAVSRRRAVTVLSSSCPRPCRRSGVCS